MKKLFILVALVAAIVSCTTKKEYTLVATLDGVTEGKAYLQIRKGGEYVKIDSAELVDGVFTMKGSVEFPEMYTFGVEGKRGGKSFFLENAPITLTGHVDTLYTAKVEGSAAQAEYDQYSESLNELTEPINEVWGKIRAANQEGNTELADELQKEFDELYEGYQDFQLEFVKNNPNSFVSPTILRGLTYDMDATEIEECLLGFSKEVQEVSVVQDLFERVEVLKKVAIGMPAPDFTMNDTSGVPVTLSAHFGKVLLVDFWAAWCGPCRAENPNVVAAYRKYKDKGFDVFGVSLDRTKEDWVKAIHDDTLTWTHVSDLKFWENAAAKMYGVNAIPGNFLLDTEGKILARNVRGEDLHTKLEEILGE